MSITHPTMRVVAGPPGSGKSTAFPVNELGFDAFEADERAAELNGGSFHSIPVQTRERVNREMGMFIEEHIKTGRSMVFETTLRSGITFDQAKRARLKGFSLTMTYVALSSVELHVERVAIRVDSGGHSTPISDIKDTYAASLANLRRALLEFDDVAVYDNSGLKPELFLVCRQGKIHFLRIDAPVWVREAAQGIPQEG